MSSRLKELRLTSKPVTLPDVLLRPLERFQRARLVGQWFRNGGERPAWASSSSTPYQASSRDRLLDRCPLELGRAYVAEGRVTPLPIVERVRGTPLPSPSAPSARTLPCAPAADASPPARRLAQGLDQTPSPLLARAGETPCAGGSQATSRLTLSRASCSGAGGTASIFTSLVTPRAVVSLGGRLAARSVRSLGQATTRATCRR
jgi:hypothetical protein